MTDAGLREQQILDEAFLRAGGPTNKKLIWCGLMLLFPFFFFQNLFRYFISKGGCLIGPQVIKFSIFGRFTLLCLPPTPLKLLNRIS